MSFDETANVFLQDGRDIYYGEISSHKSRYTRTLGGDGWRRGMVVNSEETIYEIQNNMIQDDIIVYYDIEEEKAEILKMLPEGFVLKEEEKGRLVITFSEKQTVTAPLYDRSGPTDEIETFEVTFKSPELTKTIEEFKSSITQMKEKMEQEGIYLHPGTDIDRRKCDITSKNVFVIDENGKTVKQCDFGENIRYIIVDRDKIHSVGDGKYIGNAETYFADSLSRTSMILDLNNREIIHSNGKTDKYDEVVNAENGQDSFMMYNEGQIFFCVEKQIRTVERKNKEKTPELIANAGASVLIDGTSVTGFMGESIDIDGGVHKVESGKGYCVINGENFYIENNGIVKIINDVEKAKEYLDENTAGDFARKYLVNICDRFHGSDTYKGSKRVRIFVGDLSPEEKLKLYEQYPDAAIEDKINQEVLVGASNYKNIFENSLIFWHDEQNSSYEDRRAFNEFFHSIDREKMEYIILQAKTGYEVRENAFCGCINIEQAKKSVRYGKLHLDVPKGYAGQVIGKQGRNVKELTQSLKNKSVDVDQIIVHEKDEPSLRLADIKEGIEQRKRKEREGE